MDDSAGSLASGGSIVVAGAVGVDHFEYSELESITPDTRAKIDELVRQSRLHQVTLRSQQVQADQTVHDLKQELQRCNANLESLTAENEVFKRRSNGLEQEKIDLDRRLRSSEAAKEQADCSNKNLERDMEVLKSDKHNLVELIEKKKEFVASVEEQLARYQDDMKKLVNEKLDVELKLLDMESKERQLNAREKNFEQEKELMETQQKWFAEEIQRKDKLIFDVRQEMSSKLFASESRVSSLQHEHKSMSTDLAAEKQKCAKLQTEYELMNTKIRELSTQLVEQKESFEAELQCQKKLLKVYESSQAEDELKVGELSKALQDTQALHEESKQCILMLQAQLDEVTQSSTKTIQERDRTINDLRDELKHANQLLQSKHRVMLTDDEIADISPGAAAASRLIKSGHTLSSIYRDHMVVVEALTKQQQENVRMSEHFNDLCEDIRTRAPALRQMKEDLQIAEDTNEKFRRQLDDVAKEHEDLRAQRSNVARELLHTKTELERYQRDVTDLNEQVRHLVHCIELQRQGLSESEQPRSQSPQAQHLYSNIEQLQTTNQRLMSELREAQVNRDQMVKQAQEAEMGALKSELSKCRTEIDSLHMHYDKQKLILDSVCDQRDRYKRLVDTATQGGSAERSTSASGINQSAQGISPGRPMSVQTAQGHAGSADASLQIAEYMQKIETLKEDLNVREQEYQTYKSNADAREKLHMDKIEQLQSELGTTRTTMGKIDAELKYQQERFKVLAMNTDSYKRELDEHKEKLATAKQQTAVSDTRLREQQSVHQRVQDELSSERVQSKCLQESLDTSRAQQHRLQMELKVAHDAHAQHNRIITSLKSLQERMGLVEQSKNTELENKVKELLSERDHTRKVMHTQHEQHMQMISDTKTKVASLQCELESANCALKIEKDNLGAAHNELEMIAQKLIDANFELRKFKEAANDPSRERYQTEAEKLKIRLNYVESENKMAVVQLKEKQAELELAMTENKRLALTVTSFETNLAEKDKIDVAEHERLLSEVQSLKQELSSKMSALHELQTALQTQTTQLHSMHQAHETEQRTHVQEKTELQQQLLSVKNELTDTQTQHTQIKSDRDTLLQRLATIESEMQQRNGELRSAQNNLTETQSQMDVLNTQILDKHKQLTELTQTADKALINHNQEKLMADDLIKSQQAELTALKDRNETLFQQIQSLANETAVLQRTVTHGSVSELTGDHSMSAFSETLKYLRSDKETAETARDAAENEARKQTARVAVLEELAAKRDHELQTLSVHVKQQEELLLDRASLQSRVQQLEHTEAQLTHVLKEKTKLESRLAEHESNNTRLNAQLTELNSAKQHLDAQTVELQNNLAQARRECDSWLSRHKQLMDERAAFDPKQLQAERELRLKAENTLQEQMRILSERNSELQQTRQQILMANNELTKMKALVEEKSEAAEKYQEQYKKSSAGHARAAQVGRNYRDKAQTLEKKVEELQAQINKTATAESAAVTPATTTTTAATPAVSAPVPDNNQALLQLQQQHKDTQALLDKANSEVTKLKTMLNSMDTSAKTIKSDYDKQLKMINANLEQKEQELNKVQEMLESAQSLADERSARVKLVETQLAKVNDLNRTFETQLEEHKAEIKKLQDLLNKSSMDNVPGAGSSGASGSGTNKQHSLQPIAQVTAQVQQQPRVTASSNQSSAASSSTVGAGQVQAQTRRAIRITGMPMAKVEPTYQGRVRGVSVQPQSAAGHNLQQADQSGTSSSVTTTTGTVTGAVSQSVSVAPSLHSSPSNSSLVTTTTSTAAAHTQGQAHANQLLGPPQAVITPMDPTQQDSHVSGSVDVVGTVHAHTQHAQTVMGNASAEAQAAVPVNRKRTTQHMQMDMDTDRNNALLGASTSSADPSDSTLVSVKRRRDAPSPFEQQAVSTSHSHASAQQDNAVASSQQLEEDEVLLDDEDEGQQIEPDNEQQMNMDAEADAHALDADIAEGNQVEQDVDGLDEDRDSPGAQPDFDELNSDVAVQVVEGVGVVEDDMDMLSNAPPAIHNALLQSAQADSEIPDFQFAYGGAGNVSSLAVSNSEQMGTVSSPVQSSSYNMGTDNRAYGTRDNINFGLSAASSSSALDSALFEAPPNYAAEDYFPSGVSGTEQQPGLAVSERQPQPTDVMVVPDLVPDTNSNEAISSSGVAYQSSMAPFQQTMYPPMQMQAAHAQVADVLGESAEFEPHPDGDSDGESEAEGEGGMVYEEDDSDTNEHDLAGADDGDQAHDEAEDVGIELDDDDDDEAQQMAAQVLGRGSEDVDEAAMRQMLLSKMKSRSANNSPLAASNLSGQGECASSTSTAASTTAQEQPKKKKIIQLRRLGTGIDTQAQSSAVSTDTQPTQGEPATSSTSQGARGTRARKSMPGHVGQPRGRVGRGKGGNRGFKRQ